MTYLCGLEVVDRMFRDMMPYMLSFDGNVSLCLRDFRQNVPVVRASNQSQIVNASFKWSILFLPFKTVPLKQTMRLQVLRKDENTNEDAVVFPSYLLNIVERNM